MDRVLIIDGHNFIYRACITFKPPPEVAPPLIDNWGFTNPPLEVSPPEEFGTIFNFFRNLRALVAQFTPVKCFFALEGHPQFRYDLYPDYKGNRLIKLASKSTSKELFDKAQPEILRLLKYLPLTLIRALQYEADDVINTLVTGLKDEEVIVASADSDFIQLLQKGHQHLTVYNPTTKTNRVAPEYHFIAYRAICGDKSDGIKGISGYGPKKTLELISDPEKLHNFLSIEENRSLFSINTRLIEFKDVPPEDLLFEEGQTDFTFLQKEFVRMEFKTILKEPYWTSFQDTFSCLKI